MSVLRETSTRFPHVAIRASAGAGKTFQLTNRYLALVVAGESPDRILATTFTRKAAGEILARVLTRLATAVLDVRACASLGEQLGDTEFDTDRARVALVRVIRELHRLRICTLDSFFGGLASTFGLDVGLPPTYAMVEDDVDDALRAEALQATVRTAGAASMLRLLQWLRGGAPSQRVVASAARVVTRLHDVFLEAPTSAWRNAYPVAGLSPDALRDALEHLRALIPSTASFARAIEGDCASAENADWTRFLTVGVSNAVAEGRERYASKAFTDLVRDAYAPIVAHALVEIRRALTRRTAASFELLEAFDREYRSVKQGARAMSFEDVTRALASRAATRDLDPVYFRLDGRIAHVLLDEFQDTSRIQWRVLRPFAEEVVAHSDESRSFFCVGDVKQAIYGWRGGVAEIFEALDHQLPTLEWRALDQSRRSAPAVIDAINRIFVPLAENPVLAGRDGVAEWAAGFFAHTTARVGLPGFVELEVAAPSNVGVLESAARRIVEIHASAPNHTIGVLVRSNAAVATVIDALRRLGIRASQEGGNLLTDSPAVCLVLSALCIADHPGDTVARFHVATSPLARTLNIADSSDALGARAASRTLRSALVRDGFGATVEGLGESLMAHCDARDRTRLRQLAELAARFDAEAALRADAFCVRARSVRVDDPDASAVRVMTIHQAKGLEFDTVVLPDLDGMRFRADPRPVLVERSDTDGAITRVSCALPRGLVGLFPDLERIDRMQQAQAMRESLSVLYVALTRAIHALHVVIAASAANEKSVPSTAAGVLRTALVDTEPARAGASLYAHGDRRWFASQQRAGVPLRATERATIAVRDAGPPARAPRNLPRVSPSEMHGERETRLRDRLSLRAHAQRRRGALLHAFLENIEWLDAFAPDDAPLAEIARRHGFSAALASESIREFRAMLTEPATRAALSKPAEGAWRVRREHRFAIRDGATLLVGAFDRLVTSTLRDAAAPVHVIDFKTQPGASVATPDAIARLVAEHRAQMEAYRYAAAKITGMDPALVRTSLLFLRAGLVVDVPRTD